MILPAVLPAVLLAFQLAACDRPHQAEQPGAAVPAATATRSAPAPAPVPAAMAPAAPSASRDPAEALAAWAAAVEARNWPLVQAFWGHHGADSGLDAAAFAAKWNRLAAPKVTLGPAEAEGAAGSLFYDAPVMIADGPRRLAGHVVLRRVNDVDGATPEDLRWHIQSSTLEP